jgi:hypothetical protein
MTGVIFSTSDTHNSRAIAVENPEVIPPLSSRGLNVVEGFVADVYLHDSVAIGHPKFDSRQIFERIFSGIAQGHGLNSNLGRLWLAVFLAAIIVSPKVVEQRIDEGQADNTDRAGGFGSPR